MVQHHCTRPIMTNNIFRTAILCNRPSLLDVVGTIKFLTLLRKDSKFSSKSNTLQMFTENHNKCYRESQSPMSATSHFVLDKGETTDISVNDLLEILSKLPVIHKESL